MKLGKNRVLELLAEADTKWFNNHHGEYKYHEHLEFLAEYVAKNYHKKEGNNESYQGNIRNAPASQAR